MNLSLHPGESLADQIPHEQRERFAVAALGLLLEYNEKFCDHFMARICSCQLNGTKPRIQIEPYAWADLLIEAGRSIYIIECKLGAALQNHQNPANKQFWGARGYGSMIEAKYSAAWRKYYVTLGATPWGSPNRDHWQFDQHQWNHLTVDHFFTGWERSFFELLIGLGCSEIFSDVNKELIKQPVSSDSLDGFIKIWKILYAVAQKAGLGAAAQKPEFSASTDSDFYFGLKIKRNLKADLRNEKWERLQKLVRASGNEIGWFGYFKENEDTSARLDVWMYCSDNKGRADCIARLGGQGEVCDGYFRLTKGESELPDGEWLIDVFEKLTTPLNQRIGG